jgi:predicted flap endonuclease-1-like 5' DNA nuclease/FtsZ-binding cell division protein ZapB
MPDLNTGLFIVAGACLSAGVIAGWILRSGRSKAERNVINEGWQIQMEDSRREQSRLALQNQELEDQVDALKTANRDAGNRTRELSAALREMLSRRDALRHEINGVRGNIEDLVSERDRLSKHLSQHRAAEASAQAALRQRDSQIAKLQNEVRNWQERMRPLIDKFRERNEDAIRLEAELADARERLSGMEDMLGSDQTRVEPMAAPGLLEAYEASNEQLGDVPCDDQLDDDDLQVYSGLRDNLRRIKGIGPAIEKTLNELGIFRYAQVASLTSYDVVRIGNRLKGSHSRIERENWIDQARELAEAGETQDDQVDLPGP